MEDPTSIDTPREPLDPVGEFVNCINQPVPEAKDLDVALFSLRGWLLNAIHFVGNRAELVKFQEPFYMGLHTAKQLPSTECRAYGIAAGETVLSLMVEMTRRMRPAEADQWVYRSRNARKVIPLLSDNKIVHINQIARLTELSARSVTNVIERMEETMLASFDWIDEQNVFCRLLPGGTQLQESIKLKRRRRRRSS